MTIPYGWPQHPMMDQVEKISPSLPMTFIYGSRSSIEGQSGKAIQEMRPNSQTKIIVSFISVITLSSPKLSTVTVFFLIPPRSSRVQVTTYLQTNQKTSTRLCSRYAIMNAERRENMSQVWVKGESDEGVKGEIDARELLYKRKRRQKISKKRGKISWSFIAFYKCAFKN